MGAVPAGLAVVAVVGAWALFFSGSLLGEKKNRYTRSKAEIRKRPVA
jgi:membrane protein DedA with SNARE-associated domain